jgi:hypothetical protein
VWKYAVGNQVRISRYKHKFEKGYSPNWTEEIFIIDERFPTHPVTYGLRDSAGKVIKGRFYEQEIQKVVKTDNVYIVEKVPRTRRCSGILQHYFEWKGYPDKFNSWTTDVFVAH